MKHVLPEEGRRRGREEEDGGKGHALEQLMATVHAHAGSFSCNDMYMYSMYSIQCTVCTVYNVQYV